MVHVVGVAAREVGEPCGRVGLHVRDVVPLVLRTVGLFGCFCLFACLLVLVCLFACLVSSSTMFLTTKNKGLQPRAIMARVDAAGGCRRAIQINLLRHKHGQDVGTKNIPPLSLCGSVSRVDQPSHPSLCGLVTRVDADDNADKSAKWSLADDSESRADVADDNAGNESRGYLDASWMLLGCFTVATEAQPFPTFPAPECETRLACFCDASAARQICSARDAPLRRGKAGASPSVTTRGRGPRRAVAAARAARALRS